jgi:hypothetical protein
VSDWEMRDWRVPPRTRYAFAFLALAIMLSATMLGSSMRAVPDTGAFDDDQINQVTENWLSAVEALWVSGIYVLEDYNIDDDGLPDLVPLSSYFPTSDPSVRWVIQSFFMLEAKRIETEKRLRSYRLYLDGLADDIDDQFGRVRVEGTYCAWELRFNGTLLHFGSETVDGPDQVPETCWTVSHDYSSDVQWWRRTGTVPFRAKLVFHLWFETERPEF